MGNGPITTKLSKVESIEKRNEVITARFKELRQRLSENEALRALDRESGMNQFLLKRLLKLQENIELSDQATVVTVMPGECALALAV